jgi:hypothetical protein
VETSSIDATISDFRHHVYEAFGLEVKGFAECTANCPETEPGEGSLMHLFQVVLRCNEPPSQSDDRLWVLVEKKRAHP